MKPAALVTLAIGQQHLDCWKSYCQPSWNAYARAHGYDLFVFTERLDSSPLAASRSPAWQKCIALGQGTCINYSR